MNNGVVMRCDNCKNGIIRYKADTKSNIKVQTKSKIEKIYCDKFHDEVKLETFKNLRTCRWHEERK